MTPRFHDRGGLTGLSDPNPPRSRNPSPEPGQGAGEPGQSPAVRRRRLAIRRPSGGGEHDRAFLRHRDRVLDMRGAAPVSRSDGPAVVVDLVLVAAARHQPRLDGHHEASALATTCPAARIASISPLVLISTTPRRPPQGSALIWLARAKSAAVRPPAEWVDSVSVTVFHEIAMSGWWFAAWARWATAPTYTMASRKSPSLTVRVIASPARSQPAARPRPAVISFSLSSVIVPSFQQTPALHSNRRPVTAGQ